MELLDDLIGGLVQPLLHADLWLLLQVGGVGRARLSLHLGVFRQLQLLKALKLWDPTYTNTHFTITSHICVWTVDPCAGLALLVFRISNIWNLKQQTVNAGIFHWYLTYPANRQTNQELGQSKYTDKRKLLLGLVDTQEVQLLHHCSRYQGLEEIKWHIKWSGDLWFCHCNRRDCPPIFIQCVCLWGNGIWRQAQEHEQEKSDREA